MKFKFRISAIILFAAVVAWGCGNANNDGNNDTEHMEAHHGDGPEYNSAYVCPMHCEGSGSDQPGQCPVCGMDYVKQSDHMQDGHEHEHAGHGHDHQH
jgi:hypothetical protein